MSSKITVICQESLFALGQYELFILQYPSFYTSVDFNPMDMDNIQPLCQAICVELDSMEGTKIDRWPAPEVHINDDILSVITASYHPYVLTLYRDDILQRVKWWY